MWFHLNKNTISITLICQSSNSNTRRQRLGVFRYVSATLKLKGVSPVELITSKLIKSRSPTWRSASLGALARNMAKYQIPIHKALYICCTL